MGGPYRFQNTSFFMMKSAIAAYSLRFKGFMPNFTLRLMNAPASEGEAVERRNKMKIDLKLLVPLARIFYSFIFIFAGIGHFTNPQMATYAAAQGVPMAPFLVPLAGLLALVGGVSVLLGYKAKWGAWLLVAFLVPVTLVMHRFWGLTDPQAAMMQMIMFEKNLAM